MMCRAIAILVVIFVVGLAKVHAESPAAEIAYLRLTNHIWQVWLTDERGSTHRQLTFDGLDKTRVSWSPDHRRLLCNNNDGSAFILDIKSEQSEKLNLDAIGVFDAQWSPDGNQVAFSATTSLQADNAEIWIANIDGSNKKKITDHIAVALTPTWNPKTGAILYSAGKPGSNQEIWSVNPVAGKSEQITISKSSALDPSVNRDGDMLFSSDMEGNYNIWMMDASQRVKKITQSDAYNAQPSWSPDGKKMVLYRLDGKARRLWVYDFASGTEHAITPPDSFSRYPAWIR